MEQEQLTISALKNLRYAIEEGFSVPIGDKPILLNDAKPLKDQFLADYALSIAGLFHFLQQKVKEKVPVTNNCLIQTRDDRDPVHAWFLVESKRIELLGVTKWISIPNVSTGLFTEKLFFYLYPDIRAMFDIIKMLQADKVPYEDRHKYVMNSNLTAGDTKIFATGWNENNTIDLSNPKVRLELLEQFRGEDDDRASDN